MDAQKQTQSRNSRLDRIIEYGFPTNHLLTVSLVRQEQDRGYKSPFYAFFSGAPAGKNGIGKTYLRDQENAVVFKLEMPKLNAVRFSLLEHASGSGNNIAKPYIHWADPSKANAPGSKIATGKNFSISSAANAKSPGERIVAIAFNGGQEVGGSGQKAKSFQLVYHPFDAMAIADAIQSMVAKARELEAQEQELKNKGVEMSNAVKAPHREQEVNNKQKDDVCHDGDFSDFEPPSQELNTNSQQLAGRRQMQTQQKTPAKKYKTNQPIPLRQPRQGAAVFAPHPASSDPPCQFRRNRDIDIF